MIPQAQSLVITTRDESFLISLDGFFPQSFRGLPFLFAGGQWELLVFVVFGVATSSESEIRMQGNRIHPVAMTLGKWVDDFYPVPLKVCTF